MSALHAPSEHLESTAAQYIYIKIYIKHESSAPLKSSLLSKQILHTRHLTS